MRKTNAARYLDRLGMDYKICEYEVDESDLSAETVANKVKLPPSQVFKTLVARGDRTGIVLACIPGSAELDLKKMAEISGNKKVEMVPVKEIFPLTGYVRGGVSPIGMKKQYPVFMDETALTCPSLAISAGIRGAQILLDPKDLTKVLKATLIRIVKNK